MDIGDSADEWGADIGSACDVLFDSECSLTGGFYQVTTQRGNIWEDIDGHLGILDQHVEEYLVDKIPEPYRIPKFSPREQSVARYMQMDMSQLARPESTNRTCPPQAEEEVSKTSDVVKENAMKTEDSLKTTTRPKSSGAIEKEKRPKFFRLGEYEGTRPYTADSGLPQINKVRPRTVPYFQEIQLHHQHNLIANETGRTCVSPKMIASNGDKPKAMLRSSAEQKKSKDIPVPGMSELQVVASVAKEGGNSLTHDMRCTLEDKTGRTDQTNYDPAEQGRNSEEASIPGKAISHNDNSISEASRPTKPRKAPKTKVIHVQAKPSDDTTAKDVGSPSVRSRLRNALQRFRERMSSLFSCCITCGH